MGQRGDFPFWGLVGLDPLRGASGRVEGFAHGWERGTGKVDTVFGAAIEEVSLSLQSGAGTPGREVRADGLTAVLGEAAAAPLRDPLVIVAVSGEPLLFDRPTKAGDPVYAVRAGESVVLALSGPSPVAPPVSPAVSPPGALSLVHAGLGAGSPNLAPLEVGRTFGFVWPLFGATITIGTRMSDLIGGVKAVDGNAEASLAEFLNLIHPEDRDAWLCEVFAAARSKRRLAAGPIRIRTVTGAWRTMVDASSIEEAVAGEPCVAGVFVDVTATLDAQAQQSASLAKAQADCAERTDMLACLATEIREPLGGIIGLADLMDATDLDPEKTAYTDIIRRSARSLLSLVDGVTDYALASGEGVAINEQRFNLRNVIQRTLAAWLPVLEAGHHRLNVKIPSILPRMVTGDPLRLKQVLAALLRITSQSGDTLVVDLAFSARRLEHGLMRVRVDVHLEPREGPQPGHKAGDRLSGLSADMAVTVCRQIAEAMEGSFGERSNPGGGRGFWFAIPLRVDDPAVEAAQPSQRRMLLVEDHPVSQLVFLSMLENLGYSIDMVGTGEEAVSAFQSEDYDAVLLDVTMRGESG
ncbi:MAG: histidine kinase dimerization/phospho-acceptor domain-containing protein, partial [Pseudomonadota bacterium]